MKIEILPGLWISTISFSDNAVFLKDKNIGFLVNCQKDLDFLGKSKEYNNEIRKNIQKYEILKFNKYLFEITEMINTKIKNNINTLVFCENTIQKSPTIILCYLMRYGMINYSNSLEMLRTKCPDVLKPNMEYEKTIKKFMEDLFNK
tara:strand:+ start:1357 stop:1797 length:441 start_codon:yes stop_codon:yes gene_type:complete